MASRPLPGWALLHLRVQCVSALGLGLGLIVLPPPLVLHNPLTSFISQTIFRRPLSPLPSSTSPALTQSLALSGIFSLAIGMAYTLTFYHGYEEWLYLGIPVRLLISAMGLGVFIFAPEKASPLMFGVCAWDGAWAAALAVAVGSVSGRTPVGYRGGSKRD